MVAVQQQVLEDRHADVDAVGDLIKDEGAGIVEDGVADVDVAHDWARMHDHDRAIAQKLIGDAVVTGVFGIIFEDRFGVTLQLSAQAHDYLNIVQNIFEAVGTGQVSLGHERCGCDQGDLHPHAAQQTDTAGGDPGVGNVPDDGDFFTAHPSRVGKKLLKRKQVKQRLGGVGVVARTGIDDRGYPHFGQQAGSGIFAVADDDPVGLHGAEIGKGVFEGFPLFGGGAGRIQVYYRGTEPFGCDLE